MNNLHPGLLTALARCLDGFNAVHEYTAWTLNMSLAHSVKAMLMLGFQVVHEVAGQTIFLEKGDMRVRLVHNGVKLHDTWIVATLAEFKDLHQKFESDQEFQLLKKRDELEDKTSTFMHVPTGRLIKISCRKHVIFADLFRS